MIRGKGKSSGESTETSHHQETQGPKCYLENQLAEGIGEVDKPLSVDQFISGALKGNCRPFFKIVFLAFVKRY